MLKLNLKFSKLKFLIYILHYIKQITCSIPQANILQYNIGETMNQYNIDLISPEKLYPLMGKAIKRLRREHDMTQEQLAELVGGDQNYISKIESGKARPGLSTYLKIANAFQVSIDRFLADVIEISYQEKDKDAFHQIFSIQAEQKLVQNILDSIFRYLQEKE